MPPPPSRTGLFLLLPRCQVHSLFVFASFKTYLLKKLIEKGKNPVWNNKSFLSHPRAGKQADEYDRKRMILCKKRKGWLVGWLVGWSVGRSSVGSYL